MRRLSRTALAALATVMTSAVAVAQTPPTTSPRPARTAQPAPGRQDSLRRQGPAEFGIRRGGPAANLLRLRQQLELTDAQVTQLEALRQAAPPEPKASEMMRAQADLMDATRGDVNLEKARAAIDRMARLRTDQQVAHLKVQQDARNVLTAAQKSKFDVFNANMRQSQRGMQRTMQPRGTRDMRGMQRVNQMQREYQRGSNQFRGGRGGPPMGPGPQGMGPGTMGPGMGPQGMGGQGGPPAGAPMRRRMAPPMAPPPADSTR